MGFIENGILKKEMKIDSIINYDFKYLIFIYLFLIIICLICAFFNVKKIKKLKAIELLKEE